MKTKFEERYERLNKAQKEAVDTIEGPVMVIAGPGTGKTTILTLRIANILEKTDTPPSGILAITFTEAGVKSMRMKLRDVIGARADEVRIHTFHGFASSIIHEFPEHFPHISSARQLSDIETDAYIRTILTEKKFAKLRPFGNPDLYVGSILRTISDSKKEAWSPGMLRSFAQEEIGRIKSDESMISTRGATKGQLKAEGLKRIEKCERTLLFADVYEKYEEMKKSEEAIDFDDQIIELLLAFERDELLLRLVQEKFLYLFIDEHQDTNDSQNLLVRMIANFFENPNLFVVGDEKQAVYRFQGASVENFLTFQSIWKSMKVISLTENYRSHQSILDAGYSLIENNYSEDEHKNLRVKLSSGTKAKSKPIDFVMAGNNEAALKYLVESVSGIRESEPKKTIAIITRTNRDIERVLSVLESNGIQASAERGADIFSHPLGSIFFDVIAFLADPGKVELLARTLSVGLWRLEFSKSAEIIRNVRAGKIQGIEREIPELRSLLRDITDSGAVGYLIRAALISGFTDRAIRDPLASEVWRGIVALAQDIAQKDSITDPKLLIETLLSYRASAESKSIKVKAGRSDALVLIMTAHGSKGLEYDYVYLPFATEETWMPRSRSSYFILPKERGEGDEVKDARRLFYVALTRARSHVTVLAGLSDGLGRELTPLRFLSEIDPATMLKIELPAVSETPVEKVSIEDQKRDELIEYSKNSLIERGLSVTALNHFMVCPNLFFFKSILRVPEAPSSSSEKGNAMHEALSRVWMLEEKTETSVTETIVVTVREYFGRSLLHAGEKEIIVEELIAAAPIVTKALLNHFKMEGRILTEIPMEVRFSHTVGNEDVEIPLRGKLDALLETPDKIYVYDYKTKEAMSIAAIRGETKNEEGGYFRQLIYYKILISENSKYKAKAVEPSLVFVKPDDKGRCPIITLPVVSEDVERVKSEARKLVEAVWTGSILKKRCEDDECDGCALMDATFMEQMKETEE